MSGVAVGDAVGVARKRTLSAKNHRFKFAVVTTAGELKNGSDCYKKQTNHFN
jgi:hypothetical protein